ELDAPRFPSMEALADALGPVEITAVSVPAGCSDGFLGALWQRPGAYLDPAGRRGVSGVGPLPAERVGPRPARRAPPPGPPRRGSRPTWPPASGTGASGTCAGSTSATWATGSSSRTADAPIAQQILLR